MMTNPFNTPAPKLPSASKEIPEIELTPMTPPKTIHASEEERAFNYLMDTVLVLMEAHAMKYDFVYPNTQSLVNALLIGIIHKSEKA